MPNVIVRHFGLVAYLPIYQQMQTFTAQRDETTVDEFWLVQHPPVYTLGRAAKREHLLNTGEIPVVPIDRGGQVTYHGPGQLVVYLLVNLRRQGLGVKELVNRIEQALIDYLTSLAIPAARRANAPGVYVEQAKIAALGLRVQRGCSYHGLSLNVAMDLTPFQGINPCGYPDLAVTQLNEWGGSDDVEDVADNLIPFLVNSLRYNAYHTVYGM